ncbi:MAG: class I SAM-dependent methyltransferase [Bacteroidetes bacterium]|nr:class I SAM-dependent methyltransferase [Bacteroidota bacterium]
MNPKSYSPIALTEDQDRLLREYAAMLFDVNKQFNLISREDTDHILERHIGHCLFLAERGVMDGARIVDWGSGGGLPAIPLAIVWPSTQIVAVDSNGKKTMSIELFCRRLGIKNCKAHHGRAEETEGSFQYSVSRATASLVNLWDWHHRVASPASDEIPSSHWENGLICLKGGDLREEVQTMNKKYEGLETTIEPLISLGKDAFFQTKSIVHIKKKAPVT